MVRQLKRQVREAFNLKMNAIWMPIQFKLWKQRISLNSKVCTTLVWRRKNALFWLPTVPGGLISDKNIPEQFGIVLVESPRAERNFDPFVLVQDSSFCVEKLCTDLLCFEAKTFWRLLWRNTNVYGFIRCSYADFVCYTFNGLVIIRVKFDKEYFQKLIVKLNSFYEDYVVPQVLKKTEIIFFTKKCFMFSNKKQSRTIYFTLFTILKTIYFFTSQQSDFLVTFKPF